MKTKIVYVCASSLDDYYFEQTALSAYSLRLHQPDAHVVLVVDQHTREAIRGKRENLLMFFTDVKTVQVPEEYNQHQCSRYLKTTLREHIQGDFLYIDSDTVVCEPLDAIDDYPGELWAAIDKHLPLAVHPRRKNTDYNLEKFYNYKRGQKDVNFFNSGLIFAKETEAVHKFYAEWHRLWKEGLSKGIGIDQPSLLIANAHCGYLMQELEGIWNCQVMDNGLKYLFKAKIIHYFASYILGEGYLLKDSDIYKAMKLSGEISEVTKNMVVHAKECFADRVTIVSGKEADFLETKIHTCYQFHPFIFNLIERILVILFKLKSL